MLGSRLMAGAYRVSPIKTTFDKPSRT